MENIRTNSKPHLIINSTVNLDLYIHSLRKSRLGIKTTFAVTNEPYLRSFQYKIINRIINCKDKLYQCKILETNLCAVYKEVDGVEPHIFYCIESFGEI